MTLPASVTTGVLTWDIGDMASDGAGGLALEDLAGAAVTFVAAPAYLADTTSGKLILPKPIGPVALSAGQQVLALTDTDSVNPQAWTWTMYTTLPGGLVLAPISFAFPASALDGDGQARLVDVMPVAASGGVLTTRGEQGPRGPAGIEPQGTWDAGTAYATDDAVYRNGSTYWAVQASTGVDPATDADSTYWHIMAEKGEPGDVSTVDGVPAGDSGDVPLGALRAANNLSDVQDAATARSNLGAGTSDFSGAYDDLTGKPALATVATTGAYGDLSGTPTLGTAASKNTGTASGNVPVLGTGGVLAIGRLATGTPDGTKFVRDDGTLAAPTAAGGSLTSATGRLATAVALGNTVATILTVNLSAAGTWLVAANVACQMSNTGTNGVTIKAVAGTGSPTIAGTDAVPVALDYATISYATASLMFLVTCTGAATVLIQGQAQSASSSAVVNCGSYSAGTHETGWTAVKIA